MDTPKKDWAEDAARQICKRFDFADRSDMHRVQQIIRDCCPFKADVAYVEQQSLQLVLLPSTGVGAVGGNGNTLLLPGIPQHSHSIDVNGALTCGCSWPSVAIEEAMKAVKGTGVKVLPATPNAVPVTLDVNAK